MKFKSKIDWWAHIAFATSPLGTILFFVLSFAGEARIISLIGAIFCLLLSILIMPIWLNTYYVLDKSELLVKCGIGKPTKIPYESIKKTKESKNPLASSALSLDRIEIIFGVGGVVFISPKNKKEFLQQLKQLTAE